MDLKIENNFDEFKNLLNKLDGLKKEMEIVLEEIKNFKTKIDITI